MGTIRTAASRLAWGGYLIWPCVKITTRLKLEIPAKGIPVFKTGICSLRELQFLRGSPAKKPVSYRLLRPSTLSTVEVVRAFEAIIRDLDLSSGVFRTTYRGRLQDVDALIHGQLTRSFIAGECLKVHDWAASDALVSSEWAQPLFRAFPFCRFIASDVTLYLVEACSEEREAYIFEPSGTILQYVRPPFVINFNRKDSPVFVANRLMRSKAKRRADSLWNAASKFHWSGPDDPNEFSAAGWRFRLLPLIHPEALALQRQMPNFTIISHSALVPLRECAHVIRTMNVYQQGYFGEADLARGAHAVFDSLFIGGLWILGRTAGERAAARNEVSIFKRSERGFRVLHRLNGGSELEERLKSWGLLERESGDGVGAS
jgi:hypothetical protein